MDENTAIVVFASLEARECPECGDKAEGLEQAWLPLEGDDALVLRRYLGGIAADARTPIPAAFRTQEG